MGAVYSVDGSLKFKSAQDVVAATQSFVASYSMARFSNTEFADLTGALQCIFTERGLRISSQSNTAVIFTSDFDASYGWESTMMDWFNDVASILSDGSSLKIYPDTGVDFGVVSGGTVNWNADDGATDKLGATEFVRYMYDNYPEIAFIEEEDGTGDNAGFVFMTFDITGFDVDTDFLVELQDLCEYAAISPRNKNSLVVMCEEDGE